MRTCLIFNPAARGGRAAALVRSLRDAAPDVDLRPTTGPGTASGLASSAVRDGYEVVGAAGGDGTVFEVLNGLAAEPEGLERARLAVIPMGTANVLAHELGISLRPRAALEVLRAAKVRRVDLGTAEFRDPAGAPRSAYFAVVAGAGLDARAVHAVDMALKKRVGKLAYVTAALRAALAHRDQVRCRINGEAFEGRAVLAGNGRLYAGAIPVFGDGALDSGFLHIRGVRQLSAPLLVQCAVAYLTGRWEPGRRVASDRLESLDLDATDPTPLQLDGEWVGWLPARLGILPGRLQVIAP